MSVKLDDRVLAFLRESNAIEDINNIDYALPENAQPDSGHVGAWLHSQQLAKAKTPLSLADICTWQRWLTEEQARFGHPMPANGIGKHRGLDVPVNVYVGSHTAPPFFAVPELLERWIGDLNTALSTADPRPAVVRLADLLGEFFQRFEAIHPFVDGNGRTGRLVANYISTREGALPLVFRASERPAFYAAHRSKMAMRDFMAWKLRESAIDPFTGDILNRVGGDNAVDVYRRDDGQQWLVENHELGRAQLEWREAAAAKDRERDQ